MTDTLNSSKSTRRARDARIIELREQGATLESIGAQFGLTRERVRQIVSRDGGAPAGLVRMRRRQAALDRVRAYTSTHPGVDIADVASALGWSEAKVSSLLEPRERRLLRMASRTVSPVFSDAAVIDALRHAGELHGSPLSASAYDALVHAGRVSGPTSARVVQRFQSWSKACSLAGVECGRSFRPSYDRYWNVDSVLAAVRAYLLDPAAPGTYAGWDAWRKGQAETLPCGVTLRSVFTSWADLKRQALAQGSTAA